MSLNIGNYCDTLPGGILPLVTSSGIAKICGLSRFGSVASYYDERIRKLIQYHGYVSSECDDNVAIIDLQKHGIESPLLIDISQLTLKEKEKSPKLIEILNSGHVKEELAQQQLIEENPLLCFEEQVKFHDEGYRIASTVDAVVRFNRELFSNKCSTKNNLSTLEQDLWSQICALRENSTDILDQIQTNLSPREEYPDEKTYAVLEIKSRFYEEQTGPYTEIELGYWIQVMSQIHLSEAICGYFYSWTNNRGCTLWRIERNDAVWKEICDNVFYPFIDYNILEGVRPGNVVNKAFYQSLFTMYRNESCTRIY